MPARVSASVPEPAAALGVSGLTARRDLAALAEGRRSPDPRFPGVDGLDPKAGLATPNLSGAATDQALVAGLRRGCRAAGPEVLGVEPVAEPKGVFRQIG